MNISAELAAKVLDADVRNMVKKVSDGGTLSPSERQLMQNAAFPESTQKTQRALALALKYSSGARLTAAELSEVRELHPGFAPDAPVANETGFNAPASAAPPLNLTPLPSPANGDGHATREQLDSWTALYGIQHRQLRRMIARGREKNEPCPLDDPRKMPAWVEKHVEKVRADLWQKVCAAAEAAGPAPVEPSIPSTPSTPSMPAPSPSGPTGISIDLATVGGVEGEQVELFRRLFAAAKHELEEAYRGGSEEKKRTLHGRIEKIGESLRKHEAAAEAKAKRRGELRSQADVNVAFTEALNILRLMRSQRKKRVRSRLATVPPEILDQIDAALDEVGEREEDTLANLPIIKTHDDFLARLAA